MHKAKECFAPIQRRTCGNPTCVRWTKISLVLLIALTFIVVVILSLIPNSPLLAAIFSIVEWVEGLPTLPSMVILIELYGFLVPFGCPITPLVLVAGYLFGPVLGTLVGVTGACLGATVCYWWALTLLRDWAEKKIDSNRKFQAIEIAVQDQSFKLIVICRLSPILPSAILNYLFATMGVGYPMYLFATLVGVTPLAILYAYIGSLAENLADAFGDSNGSSTQTWIVFGFIVVSTILLCIFLAWIGARELKKAEAKLVERERLKENEGKLSDFSAGEETSLLP